MYHKHFKGTHYNCGLSYGSVLFNHGISILKNIPFKITDKHESFAQSCVPIYKEYFPQIIEEIEGIAHGQRCSEKSIQNLLFSMYAIIPQCFCSCFAVSNGKSIILGRNSDFLPSLKKFNTNVIYKFSGGSFSFMGNTTAFVEMEDGINEHGLALGLTSVYPKYIKSGFNAGLLLRFLLEKCKTVNDVADCVKNIPIGSCQTITAADKSGSIALIECSPFKTEIIYPNNYPYVCATNMFSSESMLKFNSKGVDNWYSNERYSTLVAALNKNCRSLNLNGAVDILSGKKGFLCQYNRGSGKDTVWSVIYDLRKLEIYRAEKNPSISQFKKDTRFKFSI